METFHKWSKEEKWFLRRRYWMYIAIYRNLGNSSQCVQAMKSDAIITRYKDKYICTKCIFSVYRYIEKLNKGVDCILIYVNACFPLTQYGILQRKNKWMYSDKKLIKGGNQHNQFEFNILHEIVLDHDTPPTEMFL